MLFAQLRAPDFERAIQGGLPFLVAAQVDQRAAEIVQNVGSVGVRFVLGELEATVRW